MDLQSPHTRCTHSNFEWLMPRNQRALQMARFPPQVEAAVTPSRYAAGAQHVSSSAFDSRISVVETKVEGISELRKDVNDLEQERARIDRRDTQSGGQSEIFKLYDRRHVCQYPLRRKKRSSSTAELFGMVRLTSPAAQCRQDLLRMPAFGENDPEMPLPLSMIPGVDLVGQDFEGTQAGTARHTREPNIAKAACTARSFQVRPHGPVQAVRLEDCG